MAAIEHQVASDLGNSVGTQISQQQPELLHVQFRVAAALEVEIAVEGAVHQRAVGIELGLPLVVGAKQFEGGVGGNQLHGRGGVDRYVGVDERRRGVTGQWQPD